MVKLFVYDNENNRKKSLHSSIIKKNSENDFMDILEGIYRSRVGDLDLSYFTNKIDLLENMKI